MHELAFVQAIFPQIWLPSSHLPLGRQSGLVLKTLEESASESHLLDSLVADAKPAGKLKPLGASSEIKLKSKSTLVMEQPLEKKSQQSVQPELVPYLKVSGPGCFQVATTMIDPGFGVIVHLQQGQTGLAGEDYILLSKLIHACRNLRKTSQVPTEFAFFKWPPGKGLAQSLDTPSMGLGALKGFLHKMAQKQLCSWLVFDPEFAQFCFQAPTITAFDVIPKGEQCLIVAPKVQVIHQDATLKQQLWEQLKLFCISSSTTAVTDV